MAIQWFPGHMHLTKKAISERIKEIDVVIELLDTATFEQGQALTGADYAFQIGSDKFIKATASANAASDLFGLAAAIN